ncbi:MAG: hypothetical protein CFH38_00110 [Alphaproteobacteria bacterium MarineAlpha10_Bin1]|nr:MAG: hypothetical protein CFH38_00110 [Alphaproteobacteria bacterium MarineAlpha10_Bin1]
MILNCPECSTRFAIDAQALRPDGRRVQCGKCEHIWFEEPPAPSALEPLSVTPLEPEEQSTIPTPNLPAITAAVGFDALSHSLEAYCCAFPHPFADGVALQGMALVNEALVAAYRDGADLSARCMP